MRDSETQFGRTTQQQEAPVALVRRARLRRPRLAWTDAYGNHEVAVEDRWVIGSAPNADVCVADRAVSRLHGELDPTPEGLWFRDLGSKNGSFVDGIRVTGALVPDGGTVRVGSTAIAVRYGEELAEERIWGASQLGELVGGTEVMRKLFATIAQLAQTDLSVLIVGETGTGKELVARALHDASARSGFPLGVIDCASMPEHLLESELFGHRRGAFTGADSTHEGIVERSDGGTLFLDEIGELPLGVQPKLLRLLETKTFRRLGETKFRRANVRFVAATHRDLRKLVNAGAFREDLYFRLAVATLPIPALREREDDIPLLVDRFAPELPASLSRAALVQHARSRGWPGNVRELRSFVQRAVALGTAEPDEADPEAARLLPVRPSAPSGAPSLDLEKPFKDVRDGWVEHLEREYLAALMNAHKRNVSAVARAAGLDRTYVHRLIKKHGL
ncbi:MAG: sigma 54-dependent Fis family transcriptional regulator [Labilithrix sp.]|nr:sigma 54-dependent Fis family transcriptional regulator [Labilithrix sp.]MBX3215326.1 sigma 54-dependent Fis family transcriptional regulator [Labilithrix sp.]